MNRIDAGSANSIAARPARRDERSLVLDEFAPFLLNQVTNRLNLRMQQHLRAHRVSVPHWRVLCLLALLGPSSIGAIAANTVIPQSTLSRVIDQLERRRLVERRIRPSNNRFVEVHLTRDGRQLFRRLLPAAAEVRDRLVAPLTQAEHRQLQRLLQKLLAHLLNGESGHA